MSKWSYRLQGLQGLTHDEVELGIRLEGVVQRDKKGKVPDCFQDGTLSECVLHHLSLADYHSLLEYLWPSW